MRILAYYFMNPFLLARLGIAVLIAFTTDLIQRMIANNPEGKLDERIDAVSAALAQLRTEFVDDGIQLGLRKGVKLEKRLFRSELADKVRPVYNAVWESFGEPSPEMEAVFPKGKAVWYYVRDDQVEDYLNIMVSGVAQYEPTLGADVLAEAESVRDEWVDLYEASETATGDKTATESEKREARENLEVELFKTIATLMLLFPRDPERFALYMQQHLLDGQSGPTPPPVIPGSSAGSTGSGGSMSGSGSTSIGSSSSASASSSMAPSSSGSAGSSSSAAASSSSAAPSSSSAG